MKEEDIQIKSEYLNGILFLEPSGEIDHHTAKFMREKMDRDIFFYRPRVAVLALSKITFMDSSGLGLILGRYTKLKDLGGCLKLENPTEEIVKILHLAGVDRLIEILWTDNAEKYSPKERERSYETESM